jgi:hypothetical protein
LRFPLCGAGIPAPVGLAPVNAAEVVFLTTRALKALIYPQIDIKKSGKTHLIEDVIETAAKRNGLANRTISLLQFST